MKQERERVKFDAETWRTQMTELEHELDGAGNKWRSQLAAARDETERQRRAAYEMQAELNEAKVKQEARKREYDSLMAEMEALKDVNKDLEARITRNKEVRSCARSLCRRSFLRRASMRMLHLMYDEFYFFVTFREILAH